MVNLREVNHSNWMAYNKETIIAEKYETIIRRNIGTSRARDFYDLYMFYCMYKDEISNEWLKLAVQQTAKKRDSLEMMHEFYIERQGIQHFKVKTKKKTLVKWLESFFILFY
jgi:predicted nucleotidyltransferase component of viral defense system